MTQSSSLFFPFFARCTPLAVSNFAFEVIFLSRSCFSLLIIYFHLRFQVYVKNIASYLESILRKLMLSLSSAAKWKTEFKSITWSTVGYEYVLLSEMCIMCIWQHIFMVFTKSIFSRCFFFCRLREQLYMLWLSSNQFNLLHLLCVSLCA